jgi:hypothetical protein
MKRKLKPAERLGIVAGALLAPLAGLGSVLRRARLFHPVGVVLSGRAVPLGTREYHDLGIRLMGPVLARFSSAWWKREELPDVLGCALRFGTASTELFEPEPGDQDLLFATIRIPVTTLFAPLSTRFHDFLANAYFGVSPFRIRGMGRCRVRVVPVSGRVDGETREDKLRAQLARGPVRLRLEVKYDRPGARYEPAALIELTRTRADDPALYFDPFGAGRGIEPAGFVHHLRVATYAASRYGRAARVRKQPRESPSRRTNGAARVVQSVG